MRPALLFLFVTVAVALVAQQSPDNQQATDSSTSAPEDTVQYKVPTLPQQGHPLDPHDVEVLTGKSSTSAPAYTRSASGGYAGYSGYYPYSANVPLFTGGQFNSTGNFGDQRFFRNFGAFNPRGFLFFGSRGFGQFGGVGFPRKFSTQPTTGTTVTPGR